MTEITLIRHGQANSAARDEAGYDRLSDLGRRQSEWLGAHLRETSGAPVRVLTGTLKRHVETADAMGMNTKPIRDARLNEIPYFALSQLAAEQLGIGVPTTREGFVEQLPMVFGAWKEGRIAEAPETFEAFEARVGAVMEEIRDGHGPALVVTSGGLISFVMRHALGLGIDGTARLALAIMNTSLHRLHPIGPGLTPVLFNAVPHLDHPDRHFARTHL